MLSHFDQFVVGLTDVANVKALIDGAARILGQLKTVDWAIDDFMDANGATEFQGTLGGMQDAVLKVSALFPARARPASRGALDPMAWLLDFFDSDLNQLLVQMKDFLTAMRGVTWTQVRVVMFITMCAHLAHKTTARF
jgi:hypothetical protein